MHSPRDYQLAACDLAAADFGRGLRSSLLVAPCGAGKTTIIAEITRRAREKGTRVGIAAHRRRLVQQIAERMTEFQIPYGVIMAQMPEEDWARHDPSAPVQICMQQTLFSRRFKVGVPSFDMLLIDEAHTYEAESYQHVGELTGYKWRVGLTATPIRGDGTGLGRRTWAALHPITTIEKLIERDLLCPTKCFGPLKAMEERKKTRRTNKCGDPVEQWLRFADGKRTVVFSSRRSDSVGVRDEYLKAGVPAVHIDAHSTPEERQEAIDGIRSGRILVACTVGLWKEGVDIPELECGQLLTAAISPLVFWQNVGRIQRKHPGKNEAIWLDHTGAIAVHGLPNTSPEWTLDDHDSVQARQKKKNESPELKPRMCKKCGMISAGAGRCPNCGAALIGTFKTETATDREMLQEVNSAEQWGQETDFSKIWHNTLFMAAAKRLTCSAAASMFKSKTGLWPEQANVRPVAGRADAKLLVRDLFPNFLRGSA